ncbi:MAG TPA: hypothetical protein VL992_12015 [Tepidisphaeraceae bacterium]|nr:hypothetical protein [Tepidisphaeraceae bacterium]
MPRPGQIKWLCFFSLLSAVIGLVWSDAYTPFTNPIDAQQIYTRLWGVVGLPLDSLLLVATLGLWYRKTWSKVWLIRWSLLELVYSTIQLVVGVTWIAPHANLAGAGEDGALINQYYPGLASAVASIGAAVTWISALSLALWVLWALTRPNFGEYFETSDAITAAPPPIPQVPPPGRAR